MKKTIASLILVGALLVGCASYDTTKFEPYVRVSASTATTALLLASGSNASRDAAIAKRIATTINGLTNGTVITPDQFRTALLAVVPNQPQYLALVGSLTGLYALVQPNIKTNYAEYLQLINDLSSGVLDATAGYSGA